MHLSISLLMEPTHHSTPPLDITILIMEVGEQDQHHTCHISTVHHHHPTVITMVIMGQYTNKVREVTLY